MASLGKIAGKSRKATTTIETALVLSFLLLPLVFGLMEYGLLFLRNQGMEDAARDAARVAILPSATNSQVLAVLNTAMSNSGMTQAKFGYTVTLTPGDVSAAASGSTVTVLITMPYSGVNDVTGGFIPTPANLHASVSMAKEGP